MIWMKIFVHKKYFLLTRDHKCELGGQQEGEGEAGGGEHGDL